MGTTTQKSRTGNHLRWHLLSNTMQNPTLPGHQVKRFKYPRFNQLCLDKPGHTFLPLFAIPILCHIFLSLDVSPVTSNTMWKHILEHKTKNNGKTSGEEPEKFLRAKQSPDVGNYKAHSAQGSRMGPLRLWVWERQRDEGCTHTAGQDSELIQTGGNCVSEALNRGKR